jgi:Mor family transcriptional regulator
MRIDELLDGLDENTFKDNFKTIVEMCGVQMAKDLIKLVGGIQFYVPKANSMPLLKKYVIKRYQEFEPKEITKLQVVHKLVVETNSTETTINKIIRSLIKSGELKDHFKRQL